MPLEHGLLGRLEHAVEAADHRQRQDDLAVLGLLVVAAQQVGDRPDEGGVVADALAIPHRCRHLRSSASRGKLTQRRPGGQRVDWVPADGPLLSRRCTRRVSLHCWPLLLRLRPRACPRRRRRANCSACSGSQPAARLLHRRQRFPCSGQRPGAHIHARRLCGNRDLLAGRRIPALTRLLRRLHTHGQLHQPADSHLLGIPPLLEQDLIERRQGPVWRRSCSDRRVGDGGDKLRLGQGHGTPPRTGFPLGRRRIQGGAADG